MRRFSLQIYNRCCNRQNGFTLFESAVAAIVIAVLAGVLLTRVLYYQEQAELAAVERTAATLRVALQLRAARLYAGGRQDALAALAAENPMDWLADKPANYAGEFAAAAHGDVAAGKWYFDTAGKTLVYVLGQGKTFQGTEPKSLRFKVSLPARGTGAPAQSAAGGIVLYQVPE